MTVQPRDILVVEDSATQAAVLADLLERHGYAPRIARTAEKALEAIAFSRPDLVLSDVVMPGMDGYELCRRIKASAESAEVPVVLLTSLIDPLAIVRGLASGADHYVTKPYEAEWLLSRLEAVFERQSDRRVERPAPITLELLGTPFTIRATKEQILELLVSSYSDLVRSSQAVREAERRSRFLADAGELFSSSLQPENVLRDLAHLAVPRIADLCVADILSEDGERRRVAYAASIADLPQPPETSTSDAPQRRSPALDRALDLRVTQLVEAPSENDLAALASLPHDDGAVVLMGGRSLLVIPLIARERVLGVLQFLLQVTSAQRGADDVMLVEELARRAALAVDNARLYELAQRASRARDDVLAIVSHDLRNPLNTIQMSTSFLLDVLATPGADVPIVPQLQVMRRATRRANALIQDLLDVSRIDAGTLGVAASPVSAQALLNDVAQELQPITADKKIELLSEWTGDDAMIEADRGRIEQVFSNLAGNAVKFTPAGGRITLTGRARDADVVFEVIDDGAGIAVEHLPHLFDRFWQATPTSRSGAGLGLSIVKGIVNAHGGLLDVTSVIGEGTRFSFSIPRSR